MTTRPIVQSEVWINGNLLDVKLSPYICEYGLWLHNESGGWGGPHTEINIRPLQLASILEAATDEDFTVELNFPELGKIDECSGYAAADVGPHTRKIKTLRLIVRRERRSTFFHFEGSTGFIEPNSVRSNSKVDWPSFGNYIFSICFAIDNDKFSEHLSGRSTIEAMSSFMSAHIDETAR